ncbi:DUF4369 domain-containing protein [Larkinella insperata]|uniref:DUF4369 domain-containing protein n=1 Tax=Larkinella insperata TaxID=332158 RepID=A0ABW3Q3J7_9BACT|nr:DUF4369 domain-containing protein [Larkinella insperata]
MKIAQLLTVLVFVLTVAAGLAQPLTGYQINGHVRGLSDQAKIYLIDGGKGKVLDSAVVRHERFAFSGTVPEPVFVYLYAGKGPVSLKLTDILLDNRTLAVEAPKPVYDSVVVSGSDIDRLWKEWWRKDQQIGYQRIRIKKVYETLLAKNDTANARPLKQIVDEMTAHRIDLLKTYVKQYHTSAVGAVLPTLCALGKYLTRADYLEMYQMLSVNWQQSRFGREILQEAGRQTP